MRKSDEVEIRVSTSEDIQQFFGHKLSRTVKAWSVIWRGELVCIAGYTVEPGGCVVFSDVKQGLDAPKTLIWKTIKRLMALIAGTDTPLLTVSTSTNGKLLRLLGFHDTGKTLGRHPIFRLKHERH